MADTTPRATDWKSTYDLVVISPATTTKPVAREAFTGDAAHGVFGEAGVEHCVRNLIGDFVRVTLSYGLGCK